MNTPTPQQKVQTNLELANLKIKELHHFLNHVRLGEEHLLKKLKQDTYGKLLALSEVKEEKVKAIKSNLQEQASKAYLLLMTIVTSCIGGWLGFAEFQKYSIHGFFSVVIVAITIVACWLVGYLSYKVTKKDGSTAITALKLNHLQATLLTALISKNEKKLQQAEIQIAEQLSKLPGSKINKDQLDFTAELATMDVYLTKDLNIPLSLENITDEEAKLFYLPKFKKLLFSIKKKLHAFIERNKKVKELSSSKTDSQPSSSFEVLLEPLPLRKQKSFTLRAWLKNNTLDLITGLLPTILGGFASLFVFLNGIPALFKKFDFMQHIAPETLAYLRLGSLSAVGLLTLFFAYTYFYANYKLYQRERELEKIENTLIHKEHLLSEVLRNYHSCSILRSELRQLVDLFEALRLSKHLQN